MEDRFVKEVDYNDMDLVDELLNYDEDNTQKKEWEQELLEDLNASRWPA